METNEECVPKDSRIYICAPVNALVEGIYEENIPFTKIKKRGDFGLGTFNDLDGEMVMLDGHIYQITSDGRVSLVGDETLTPFACVTFFKPNSHNETDSEMTYEAFLKWLNSLLPSPNLFYAIRIYGVFAHIKVRSVAKQENYRSLVEVTKEQSVLDFYAVEGTLAGFFTPCFMESLNVPGLHLHFLSADLQHGGHLLSCSPRKMRAGIQFIDTLELSLPMSDDYLSCDLCRDISHDLERAEK